MEHKFKGKSIEGGEWFDGSLIHDQDGNTYIGFIILHEKCLNDLPEDVMWSVTEVHPDSVSMWTSLKDKNGIEIYSGDIVAIPRDYIETVDVGVGVPMPVASIPDGMDIYVCKYDIKQGMYIFHGGPGEQVCWEDVNDNPEVIGNIHQNPELIGIDK